MRGFGASRFKSMWKDYGEDVNVNDIRIGYSGGKDGMGGGVLGADGAANQIAQGWYGWLGCAVVVEASQGGV